MDQDHNVGGARADGTRTCQGSVLNLPRGCALWRELSLDHFWDPELRAGMAAGLESGRSLTLGLRDGWRGRAAWGPGSEERFS